MRRLLLCVLAVSVVTTALPCFSQQTDIRQFAVFGGYTYLATRSLNLTQRGFDGDFGYNYRPWLTFGFDFGYYNGHNSIFPSYLNAATQAKLAQLIGSLPPAEQPIVLAEVQRGIPVNISTFTYEAGPQLNYRRLKHVTFFVRPALGALHAKANSKKSNDAIQTAVVQALLGKSSASDTVPFYGFGGGMTWEITPHFGLRATGDFAHYDFFSSVLNGGRNSVRFSIGTKFGFGKNILEK
jgi:hypothetical protein